MTYDNTNSGIIGKNTRKSSDNHPDITGSINIEGVEYFLDGWGKKRNDGSGTFYSLKAKKKDKQPNADSQQSSNAAGSRIRDLDDEIPFAPEFR